VIGLDTNVVVRLLVGDDAAQQQSAREYITRHCSSEEPAWIDRIVAVETVWVLERSYGFSSVQIADAFEKLLDTAELAFEDHDLVRTAIALYRRGAGFGDALVAECNVRSGCTTTITFDAAASKRLSHFGLLQTTKRPL
jgi:predicted nucleic-acid-binding protein